MKHNWDIKPSGKKARILSSTFIITGILCFLLYTWNDYTEKNITSSSHSNDIDMFIHSTVHINSIHTTAISHTTSTIQPLRSTSNTKTIDQEEVNQNIIKVEEQISSMRKEIETSSSSTTSSSSSSAHLTLPSSTDDDAGQFNPMKNLHQILNTSPVVLFINSQTTSADELNKSNTLKNFLQFNYEISPQVAIVDLNKHQHGTLLQDYIKQYKLNRNDNAQLPYLFINSRSVLDNNLKDNLSQFHDSGDLLKRFKNFADGKVIFEKIELPSNN